ncbi:MAG TPA: gamma-glutamyl-gamma-aminobutyrate hydrolase family protein [Thermoanaerobaculia bacterium]|nr:gamma-glutamyl-gamma-aminobutyrate hydrolase family protein [Thermoanaerobaculia bacterium]
MKPLIGIGSDVQKSSGKRDEVFAYSTYIDALKRAGAIPVLIPPQPENAAGVVAGLDGVLLAGGQDCDPRVYGEDPHPSIEPMDRRRQDNDLSLAKAARERGIPTLGICLGMQVMNVASGGTLVQDIPSEVNTDINHVSDPDNRARHDVALEANTKLASIIGGGRTINVNSSHHQAVKDVARGFRVTAEAPDGIVEGLEDPAHPFYVGVQWHPEDMPGENSASAIFGAFVAAARKYAQEKRQSATDLSPASISGSE